MGKPGRPGDFCVVGAHFSGAGARKAQRKKTEFFYVPSFLYQFTCTDQPIGSGTGPSSESSPFRSWSVIAQTAESDQTFSAVSTMSMMV